METPNTEMGMSPSPVSSSKAGMIALSLILLVVGLVAGYVIGKGGAKPQATASPSTTTDWKTFSNPNGGYEFKYPTSWNAVVAVTTKNSLFGKGATSDMGEGGVEVNADVSSIEEFMQGTQGTYSNQHTIMIDGISGIEAEYSGVVQGKGVMVIKDGSLYNIYINSTTLADIELFDKLVSTFKFIN